MNKKFKVGDVVVLVDVRYLDALEIGLAKERHLFEVEGMANDIANLKSISANIETEVYAGHIRHATLKEQYLRDGNSIVFDGKGYLVSGNTIVGSEYGFNIDYFCDDLLSVSNRKPITKVFHSTSGNFKNKINVNHYSATILWERKPEINLTRDEIVILKNINEKCKYIARDNDGTLCVYEEEPKIENNMYIIKHYGDFWENLNTFKHLFQDITFESGALLISDLIGGNQNE